MFFFNPLDCLGDHCRIGSLEILRVKFHCIGEDHCRIGSLEKRSKQRLPGVCDHCRIGSLEMDEDFKAVVTK